MAVPLDEALSELGRTWHGFFPNSAKAAPSEPTPASA
jgi:hypothetical protein